MGPSGPKGLTFRENGTAVLFGVRKPLKLDYGAPLFWQASRGKDLIIWQIDEEGSVGGPKSITDRIENDELILSEGYQYGIPRRLTRQK